MNKPVYFLIGGGGFLGSAFALYLQAQNAIVHKILKGDISDAQSFCFDQQALSRLPVSSNRNVIIDFAYTSVPKTSFSDPVKDFSENLYNINCHLAFASSMPRSTYIYISSGGTIYGEPAVQLPIGEESPTYPLSPYGITKLASEKYAYMHSKIHDLDVKIVRASNVYGPGQLPHRGQGFVATALAKSFEKQPIQVFGEGDAIRDYLHIDDFVQGLYTIVEQGKTGEAYNLGSGTGYTNMSVLQMIMSTSLAQPLAIEYLPSRPFDVKYNVLDISKSSGLGWLPQVSLSSGIENTSKWMKAYLLGKGSAVLA